MKKLKKFLFAAFTVAILSCLLCQPAFAAISESDVQAQVDAVGKEAVSGNVFIWFLCAIGFLKVGQKIDSFLSSLGVNVGHTGGSMLAEAMIAARGIGGIKNFSSHHFGGGRNSSSTNVNANGGKGCGGFGAGFASGGLAGVVSRKVTNSAIKTATTTPGSKPSGLGSLLGDAAAGGIGGHMYASSVSKGGNFANNVIGSVATGSISQMGSISGEKAAEALHSYMGYAALESGAENVPTFQNVEIGGGRITYDGIDIRDIRKDDLRRSLSVVIQDTHLFTGTIADNIRYGRLDATDEDVKAAAKVANARSFIRRLPDGYNTVLHSDGGNLSQGQRQLLAIARAAISRPPVLILDEATSSIDTRTEKLIEKGMDALMDGSTVFVIAHRLSTVRNSKAIMVLEKGSIIERGSHEELLEQQGRYYKLYTGQFELE